MAEESVRRDARRKHLESWKDRLGVLDDIFESFVRTNKRRGQHVSLDDILNRDIHHPRGFTYDHLSIPYFATTFAIDTDEADMINIKLNCNGLIWTEPPLDSVSYERERHRSTGWVLLPRDDFYTFVFPTMAETFQYANEVALFYNQDSKQADFKFFYDQDNIHVIVTFEMGYPSFYDDHRAEREAARRQPRRS